MSNELIDNIHKINIVDVIKNYLQLFKKGNNYLAICPFHGDTKPSLTINPQKNIFKCFACSTGGDAIKFVMLYKNLNYQQALLEIAEKFNLDQNLIVKYKNDNSFLNQRMYDLNSNYLEFCQSFLNNKENQNALN
ncbi:MAG: DNA primase, partial [Ureaplasma sp.]|nr:DNA primase [Ureaplasma sp.]